MSSSTLAPPPRVVSSWPEKRRSSSRGWLIRANFKAALKALLANGSRSFLTMLGIIIGVAAVITATIQAQGTSANVAQSFASLGTNILTVMPGSPPAAGKGFILFKAGGTGPTSLTLSDVQALQTLPHVTQVGPVQQSNLQAVYRDQSGSFQISGVATNYQDIHSLQLAAGQWFSPWDEQRRAANVVIGALVAQTLFGPSHTNPLGQTIRVSSSLFKVVGVLGESNIMNDQVIYMPFGTAQARILNTPTVGQIEVLVDDTNNINLVQQEITDLLERRHRVSGNKDDFWIQSPMQLIQNKQASASSLGALLIGIAAISLTVGGVGIMNIMLVSVTERTREIGIRLAVGARKSDIRNQFLIEALVLSILGGAIGVFFGVFTGYQIVVSSQLPFVLDPGAILLAVGVAGLTGILFGLYPAVRASDLDPIVALRTS
ncbi:FtsX-like permease family protein [Ktedonosporobacter rubrisoli]|uniref:FtsX-like permease family protein n=1 Tax=Ktedonosporobacter rubrisoli TaxID=2509675 RepID=A0A4P6JYX7_KTERU|nr:ABC transporter permease [Ktedonosporobacter rubrisoli]QBD80693.1 FtsX-like permease family protein [Ktedonosporobacter rubrisoli]